MQGKSEGLSGNQLTKLEYIKILNLSD